MLTFFLMRHQMDFTETIQSFKSPVKIRSTLNTKLMDIKIKYVFKKHLSHIEIKLRFKFI